MTTSKPVQADALAKVLDRSAPRDPQRPGAELGKTAADVPVTAVLDAGVLANLKSMAEATDPARYGRLWLRFWGIRARGWWSCGQLPRMPRHCARHAHVLKGMSASLGAEPMRAPCQELEALGLAGTVQDVTPLIDRLEMHFRRAEAQLAADHERTTS